MGAFLFFFVFFVVQTICFSSKGKLYYTLQLTSFVYYSFVAVSLIVRHLELCFFLDVLIRLRWTAIAFQDVAKPTKIYFSLSFFRSARGSRKRFIGSIKMRETRKQRAERERKQELQILVWNQSFVQSDFSDQSFPRVELALPLPPSSFNSFNRFTTLERGKDQDQVRASTNLHELLGIVRFQTSSRIKLGLPLLCLHSSTFTPSSSVCSDLIHTRFTLHYTSFTLPYPLPFLPLQVDALFGQTFLF